MKHQTMYFSIIKEKRKKYKQKRKEKKKNEYVFLLDTLCVCMKPVYVLKRWKSTSIRIIT